MRASALDPCVVVVPGGPEAVPPHIAEQLPATGIDQTLSTALILIAVALIVAGAVVMLWRSRRHRTGAALAAVVLLGALGASVPLVASPENAYAAPQEQCSLISITDIRHDDAEDARNLLPGQKADAVTFTVTNVTASSIAVTSVLAVTGGNPGEFVADIKTDGGTSASGLLSDALATAPLTMSAGEAVTLTVSAGPVPDLTASGVSVTFDAVVTATGP